MKLDLASPEVQGWLDQFGGNDRNVAEFLVGRLLFVSADEFQVELTKLLKGRLLADKAPTALFAEAEVRTWKGRPNRLFPEKGKPLRAFGKATNAIMAKRTVAPETGSEGIVGNFITQFARSQRFGVLIHPGADLIRGKRVRRFILVTDFIGSGTQAANFLDAAWRVASVKSWKSGGFLKFEVVCYSATQVGLDRLRAHPCSPDVHQVIACPTVSELHGVHASTVADLIARYGPKDSETKIPRLGFSNLGALIAFAHGMPNNAPRIFFKAGKNWKPLFQGRVTRINEVPLVSDKQKLIAESLSALHQKKLALQAAAFGIEHNDYLVALVLVALKRKPRRIDVLSSRTELSISECDSVVKRLIAAGLLDNNLRPTPKAFRELAFLRKPREKKAVLSFPEKSVYVPQQLRAPKEAIR